MSGSGQEDIEDDGYVFGLFVVVDIDERDG
jgi:hypothetical protein